MEKPENTQYTQEEWEKLESLVAEYQEKNPDWERTGFERLVLGEASKPYNPERPEKTDDSENPNCDEEPTTDSENESVADEGADICEE